MNKEKARASFTLPGEEPLDEIAFNAGWNAGYAAGAADERREVAAELRNIIMMQDTWVKTVLAADRLAVRLIEQAGKPEAESGGE